ncbi:hypothetical protein AAK882_06110 [Carnobacteriaceae bacterium 52-44]|jgi:hypothetical protein
MNIQKFRRVSHVISILLKAYVILLVSLILWFTFRQIVNPDSMFKFIYEFSGLSLFQAVRNGPAAANEDLAATIVTPILGIINLYIIWRGSRLFDYLKTGKTPFALEFSNAIKRLSLLMIIIDILSPLFYSLVLTLLIEQGYYFQIGIASNFVVGIILYVVSGILNYGIELQELSDNTV